MSFIEPFFASWNASGVAADFLNNFQSPPTLFRPYVRWWWSHGAVENDEIRAEVIQMAEAGFGGVEIEDVHHSTSEGTEWHTDTNGWASKPWLDAVKVALSEANSRGMGHDFAFGPAWPMAIPTIVPDDKAAAKEIVLGKTIINATTTYNGSVPGPFSKRKDGVNEQELVAVQAWRISQDSNPYGDPVHLDYGSMVDLTDAVTDGKVAFSPPDNSSWLLFSAVIRGTGQQPEDYPHTTTTSYVVDHFSEAGAQAVIDFWEDQILTPEMLELIAQTPTSLFEDSQEMVSATYWTPNFADEFLSRRGYSVMDILPVITQYKNNAYLFLLNDSEAQRGSLHDYHETITDLYADYHIAPLRKWLNSRGMKYRAQPYGIDKLDSMRIATTLDIPEGESLGFQVIDDYRVLAGANSFAGVNVMSNELGAYNKAAYATTWAKILGTVNPQFAAGLTHNNGASDDHYVGPYFTSEGAQIGWTTTYIDEYLLQLPSAVVKDGHLAPDAGNYSLLVVAEDPDAGQAQLTPTSASKLRDLADEGLSMLFLGNWTSPGQLGLSDTNSTSVVTDVEHLLSLSNVVNVANSSDIPTGLEKLGLSPAVTHSASPLIHIRREYGDFDLYFFTANSSSTGVNQDVSLPIRHEHVAPLELDPWSGEVNLAGQYTIVNGRLNIGMSLEPQQSKILIVAPSSADVVHVVNSTADSIFRNSTSGQLFVRNGEAGDHTIVLNNSSQLTISFKAALPALDLTDWAVEVDGWQPANENPSDDVEDIVATKFVHHSLNLTTLTPWSDIDGLQNVSGNATYSTEFVLGTADAPYGSDTGTYIELDMFQGSFRARINGEALGALDQMAHRFDVSEWLRNGTNTLEIEVATSLINRMRAFQPQYYEQYARQKYGLRSVTIRPFSQVAL
ncbi:hypothetical protein K4K49_010136 [Colletotrichum sp. SAR 10_70]|nr:hypothetical protein K4K50_008090 [Colletotrichum sp. SAR 10_71]KAI8194067.1 hypothetical protein K4K49_010136 [Colletotrichum sp. SAR 10_70]KAI8215522.1 hypothetical protein K4K52_006283 [Colletotrichum sp. SAR 10_76]KAI8261799.1 hypothetical protein K4K53_000216 [Colletotrichum sp. SAR 10_77]